MTLVNVAFQLVIGQKNKINIDHSYSLYSALVKIVPELHEKNDLSENISICKINGTRIYKELLLTDKSRLTIRIPLEIVNFLNKKLYAKVLNINGSKIVIGNILGIYPVESSSRLYSPFVFATNKINKEDFKNFVQEHLNKYQIKCKLDIGNPRCMLMHQKNIVGFSVKISDLNEENSMQILRHGIGKGRKMGCGIFMKDCTNE